MPSFRSPKLNSIRLSKLQNLVFKTLKKILYSAFSSSKIDFHTSEIPSSQLKIPFFREFEKSQLHKAGIAITEVGFGYALRKIQIWESKIEIKINLIAGNVSVIKSYIILGAGAYGQFRSEQH